MINLKQVVLSISEESDARLRRLARKMMNGRKGSISQTVEASLILLEKRTMQAKALIKLKTLSEENKSYGIKKFRRSDAYA